MMVTRWPDGTDLREGQIQNFKSAYGLYEILYKAYSAPPPEGVTKGYWKNKVIQAFNAQVYFLVICPYAAFTAGRELCNFEMSLLKSKH